MPSKLPELFYTIDKAYMLDTQTGDVLARFFVFRRGDELAKIFSTYTDAEKWIDKNLKSSVTRRSHSR